MGGKSSTEIKRIVENNMLFSVDLESISKTMINVNTEVENKIKQAAENYAEQRNKMNLSGSELVADGATVIVGQSNKGKSALSVSQIAEIMNDISANITTSIVNSISDALDIETIQKLLSEVEDQVENSASSISSAGREDSSKIDETIKNNTEVKLKTKLENYVENVVNNNVVNHSDKYCGTKFLQSNDFELVNGKITAKNNGVLELTQNNEVEITSECSQVDTINNQIIVDLCTGVGIEVSQEVKTKMQTESEDKAKNDIKNEGLGEDLGDAARGAGEGLSTGAKGVGEGLSDIATGIGSGIGTIFESSFGIIAVIFGVICCIMIVGVLAIAYMATNKTFGENLGIAGDVASKFTPQGNLSKALGR